MKSITSLSLQPRCLLKATKVVGIAADHGGHELKEYLARMLREAGAEVIDRWENEGGGIPDQQLPLLI